MDLAVDLAEKQLSEGTASAMLITHYVRMASQKARLEQEKLQKEIEFLRAKTDAYEADRKSDEKYDRALRAFSMYSGNPEEGDNEEW